MRTEPWSEAVEQTLDAVASLVIIIDPDGRVLLFNKACEELTGYTRAEVCGRTVWESVLAPEEVAAARAWLARLAAGEARVDSENQWLTRGGERRRLAWSTVAVRDAAGGLRHAVGTGTDVTEQRRAGQSLRESEQRFGQLAETVDGVLWMCDAPVTEVLYVSPAYERVWGRSCRSLYDAPASFADAVVDADRPRVLAALTRVATAGFDEEYRLARPDGSVVWVRDRAYPVRDERGAVYRVCGIAEDVTARKAAEAALRESNDRYQALFDATSDAVVMHENGIVLEVNRSCLEMFGFPAEEMIGRNGMELVFPPESRARVRDLLAAGHQGTYEAVMRRKDGSTFLAEVRGRTIEYKGRRVRVVSNHDVTECRRAELALQESERRLRLAVDNSPDLMFHQDPDLRFTWMSKTVPPLTLADVIGKTDADLVDESLIEPADASRLHEVKRRVLQTGTGERVETCHRIGGVTRYYETAVERHVDADGRVAGIACYARDVTERKVAEQALRGANEALERRVAARTAELEARTRELEARSGQLARSEQDLREQGRLLRLIVDHMGDGVAVADRDGRFLLFNPAAERIIGARPADMPLASWPGHFRFCLADGRTPYPAHDLPLQRALRGESTDDVEIFVRHPGRPEGSWISTTARPIRDEHGRLAGGVTVIRDLSDRKAAEQALRQSEQHHRDLAEHNRWLVRELEHRVGNNLASLLALVSLMRGRSCDVAGFADAMEARLHAMSGVHRLLATAGGEPVGLGAVVGAALGSMQSLASHAPAEIVDGPDVSLPKSQVLPLMLILVEWYTNSCKYGVHSAPGDGVLTLTWEVTPAADGAGQLVRLHWRERGGPRVPDPTRPSLGTHLVGEFAKRELGGRCVMRFPADGADHTLEFRIS